MLFRSCRFLPTKNNSGDKVQEREAGIAAKVAIEGDQPIAARGGKGCEIGIGPASDARTAR